MKLTDQQRDAVYATGPLTIVVAPAGAGKTQVMVRRIEYLLESGTPPDRILAVTFTRAAARNIRQRVLGALKHPEPETIVNRLTIGTIHSRALHILQAYGDRIGYDGPRITVLTDEDRELLLKDICAEQAICRSGRWRHGMSWQKINRAIEAFDAGEPSPRISTLERLVARYKRVLQTENLMTFGDLLRECRRLFRECPDILRSYQQLYDHCIVDEAQDSSAYEYSLYESFCPPADLFIVGDLRQCAPPDSMVATTHRGSVEIASLIDGDEVLTFAHGQVLGRRRGYRVTSCRRRYRGDLVKISLASGEKTRVTPQHTFLVKFRRTTDRWVTYLMKRGQRWRVGWCQLFSRVNGGFHLGARARIEGAERVWVLGLHGDKTSASIEESVIAAKWGLPLSPFHPVNGAQHLTQEAIDRIFSQLNAAQMESRAHDLLRAFNRDPSLPIYERNGRHGRTTLMKMAAANILVDSMLLPVPDTGKAVKWIPVQEISRSPYHGDVISLDVQKHHTYIQDGIITCNSIYAWRFARPQTIHALARRPEARVIDLEQSFRCGDRICDVANRLIAHNVDHLAGPMTGATGRIGNVELFAGNTEQLGARVESQLGRYRPGEIAVLARSHRLLANLARHCTFPVHRVGRGMERWVDSGFERIACILRLKVNPANNVAFRRLAAIDNYSIHWMNELAIEAAGRRCGLYEAARKDLAQYHYPDIAADTPVVDAIRIMSDPAHDEGLHWLERRCADMTVREAVACIELARAGRDEQDDLADELESVRLLTVHAAKGLEWPCVVVIDLNEGVFPSGRSAEDAEALEEERRVAYTAFTRASELLILHYRAESDGEGGERVRPPSRFIREAGLLMEAAACPA